MAQEGFAKKEILENSPYKINQHVTEYEEWNAGNLEDRQKWLSKQAQAIWRIPQLEQ